MCRSEQMFCMCNYHGQVDANTGKPHGIGMAINSEGHLYEGVFEFGELKSPQIITYYNGNGSIQMYS